MNPALAALAVAVIAGGVLAVSARDARLVLIGLLVALVLSPLIASPLPATLALLSRWVSAVLAGYLIWIVIRDGADFRWSRLGWPAEGLIAAAAAIAGFSSTALTTPALTEGTISGVVPEAQAAGFALAALAAIPVLEGRDAFRLGIGLSLAAVAAALLQQGFVAGLSGIGHVAFAVVVVVVVGATSALAAAAVKMAVPGERLHRLGAHPATLETQAGERRWPGLVPARLLARLSIAELRERAGTRSAVVGRVGASVPVEPAIDGRRIGGLPPRQLPLAERLTAAIARVRRGRSRAIAGTRSVTRVAASRAREIAQEAGSRTRDVAQDVRAGITWQLRRRAESVEGHSEHELRHEAPETSLDARGEEVAGPRPVPSIPPVSARSAGARRSPPPHHR